MRRLTVIAAILISGIWISAVADGISDLPDAWHSTLTPVEEIEISTLKPDEQQAIVNGRAEIVQLLHDSSPSAPPQDLARAYGKLGSEYQAHSLNTSADNCFRNAMLLEPDNFRWAYYLAYNAHKSGNMPLALERLQAALKLDSDYPPAISRLGQTYLDLDQLDNAQAQFSKLLDMDGFQAAGHNGLGQVLLLKHDYADAVEHFTKALELEPGATQIHYPLAQALRGLGRNEEAQAQLKLYANQRLIIPDPLVEALDKFKNPAHHHFVIAMTSVRKNQYEKAVTEFEAGLKLDPDNTAARTSYARVLYLAGSDNQARSELEHVLAQDPNKQLAVFLLALLEDAANKPEEAADLYHRVLEINPDHDGANFFLGNYYLRKHDYKQALEYYDRSIANDAGNLPARLYRLVALMGNDSPDAEVRDAVGAINERAPGLYPPLRIRILLLALSRDAGVRNTALAQSLATQINQGDRNPLNTELMSLADAAAGDFDAAIPLMQQAMETERQRGHDFNADRMQDQLTQLHKKQLPELRWTAEIRYLVPPATKPLASFRDYPDANPI